MPTNQEDNNIVAQQRTERIAYIVNHSGYEGSGLLADA